MEEFVCRQLRSALIARRWGGGVLGIEFPSAEDVFVDSGKELLAVEAQGSRRLEQRRCASSALRWLARDRMEGGRLNLGCLADRVSIRLESRRGYAVAATVPWCYASSFQARISLPLQGSVASSVSVQCDNPVVRGVSWSTGERAPFGLWSEEWYM